ncbi:MAG: hybrid sensor histidine kinase/response regulator [Puniceicoccales bacterium]
MAVSNESDPLPGKFPVERDVFIHDLKNIMTGALGHLSLARRRVEKDLVVSESLTAVENILRGACSLAESALRSTEDSGPEDLSVLNVLSASVGICIPPEGFDLRLTYGEKLPLVRASRGKMQQLFNNLLTNAVHAMREGGRIRIHIDREGPGRRANDPTVLQVSIEDDGEGVPEALRTKIFEPGFSTRKGGSGVGLSSAKAWVEELGGRIDCEDCPGKGARFVVRLPGLRETDPRTEWVPRIPEKVEFSGRALVLDDDDMVQQIVEEMLEHLGWEVTSTSSGLETVRKYREAKESGIPYRFVILDLNVPKGLGGPETAHLIREYDPEARLYISSGQDTTVVNDPQEFGFAGSLKKPYTLEELSRIVAG